MVAVYYRTNLTMRQLGPLFGVSPSTVCRVIQRLGPLLALEPVSRAADAPDRMWIVDGTLIPVRDRGVGASSRNYRFSANVQVIVDAETRFVVADARPVPGNTADARAWRDSGLAEHCHGVTVLGDGAYINTGLVIPHCKRPGRALLKGEEEDQRRSPQGPRTRRARLLPEEELQDPPRLPAARRRPPSRSPGGGPDAQPRPRRMTVKPRAPLRSA
ncbi:hypothetical protein Shyhy01_76260 [Streptomyces hygroscopicus subsp. hygroscopicus]|nr:hypothetical protein Shyhy01_76260 [Streptomyces hygroscopicus subsp. hygroscopicus]